MSNYSKQLQNQDISGDYFTKEIFPNSKFNDLFVDFDRIHFDYKNKSWVIIDHILIKEKISHFDELSEENQNKIKKLTSFVNFFKEKSENDIQLIIDCYFPTLSEHQNSILLMKEDYSFNELSIDEFSLIFREKNFFGNENNLNKNPILRKNTNKQINANRKDDSAFSLSKACLANDVTYGFNIDKIIFNSKNNDICLFEYLLCEENQTVTPYTSHPNKYFSKNSQKFINLFKFSQDIRSPLFLLNYAKPNTKHHNEILWMKVLDIDKNNNTKENVLTKDIKLNIERTAFFLEKKFLNKPTSNLKIGI